MDTWSHLSFSAVLLFPSQLFVRSLLANEQQWMLERPQQEVLNHGCEKFFKKKLDVAERAGDEGAVKKIRALCPELVSKDRGDGGVDLWISLTKQMQQLQQQQLQTGRGSGTDTSTRQPNKKSERLRLGSPFPKFADVSRTLRRNQRQKVLDEKSLDFADDETKKKPIRMPSSWSVRRPSGVAEIAEAARNDADGAKAGSPDRVCGDGGRHKDASVKGAG